MTEIPLGVLDLVQIASGQDASQALRQSVDLARRAEALGYARYWIAEHHLNPGVVGSSPPLVIGLIAGATEHIRVGSGGMQMGHRTPLSVVEEFGLLDALHPGRLDLGLGRSGGRSFLAKRADQNGSGREHAAAEEIVGAASGARSQSGDAGAASTRVVEGVVIPSRFSPVGLARSPRYRASLDLLQQPGAETPPYRDQVRDVLDLLGNGHRSPEGVLLRPVPGHGASVEVWVLGSGAGESAQAAGELGLPFAANYHVSPATVLEGVAAYRSAFQPSRHLDRPYVLVSADVVVAEDDATARRLASGYGLWVRSIRTGEGAIPFPSPAQAARHHLSDADRALVADRVETQLVGGPATVVERLRALADATGANELLVTTMTHRHLDRVRSYELLAQAWPVARRVPDPMGPRAASLSSTTHT